MTSDNSDRAGFPVTSWSLISRASGSDPGEREKELEEICRLYWPPIFAYIRTLGHKTHDAEDLTQSFFEEILGKDQITKADKSRGRLRSSLLGALKHFLADEHRKESRLKEGRKAGGGGDGSSDEKRGRGMDRGKYQHLA